MLLDLSRVVRRRMNNGAGHFRSYVWDPLLIVGQILSVQFVFYACLALWLILFDYFTDSYRSLDQMFRHQALNVKDFHGRVLVMVFLFNALTLGFSLFAVVRRAKLCLDFSLTVHFLHLLSCWIYNRSFVWSATWWLLQLTCSALSTVLGEFLCMRQEMRAIPVGMGPKAEV